MTAPEVPEAWEIYPAYSDGKPAMFFLNMGLIQVAPLEALPQLYLIKVQMEDPAENGLGTNAEAQRFMPFEDAVRDAAAAAGMLMAGRVRTDGYWEIGFYGPSGLDFTDVLDNAGPAVAGFEIMLGGADDPNWGFLLDYLAPDRERWQWIMDFRVVRQLQEAGDELDKPRPVDHTIHFNDAASADAFIEDAKQIGFTVSQRHHDENRDELAHMVELQREDPVAVDHIHAVVMDLVELAEKHEGDYDGWGCPVAQ